MRLLLKGLTLTIIFLLTLFLPLSIFLYQKFSDTTYTVSLVEKSGIYEEIFFTSGWLKEFVPQIDKLDPKAQEQIEGLYKEQLDKMYKGSVENIYNGIMNGDQQIKPYNEVEPIKSLSLLTYFTTIESISDINSDSLLLITCGNDLIAKSNPLCPQNTNFIDENLNSSINDLTSTVFNNPLANLPFTPSYIVENLYLLLIILLSIFSIITVLLSKDKINGIIHILWTGITSLFLTLLLYFGINIVLSNYGNTYIKNISSTIFDDISRVNIYILIWVLGILILCYIFKYIIKYKLQYDGNKIFR